jgi:hypothetical protein
VTIESGESRSRLGTGIFVRNSIPADDLPSTYTESSVSVGMRLTQNRRVAERTTRFVPAGHSLATDSFRYGAKRVPSEATLDDSVRRLGTDLARENSAGICKILKPVADRLNSKGTPIAIGLRRQSASIMWCNIGRYRIEVSRREAKFFLDSTAPGAYHDRKSLSDFSERTKFRLRPLGELLNW